MKIKDIVVIIFYPAWKWVVIMIEQVVGLLSFYFPNVQLFQNWENFRILLPWSSWLSIGKIFFIVGTVFEATKTYINIKNGFPKLSIRYHEKSDYGVAFEVSVSSLSKNPMNILDAYLLMVDGSKIYYSDIFRKQINLRYTPNQKLNYGDISYYWFYLIDLKKETKANLSPYEIKRIGVIDSFGKETRYPETLRERMDFRKMKISIKKHWSENSWDLEEQEVSTIFVGRKKKSIVGVEKIDKPKNKKVVSKKKVRASK